ncbi:FG-GAP repeat domain-containing protein [Thiohalorhabdus methylotrophus]|uniref:FG-GAP repeat domain-containing protein n=1 Tax=Thiohalorhabdus methylotrophus TaxID=3242694 RepID=A0ABV4TQZ1_9GAMM
MTAMHLRLATAASLLLAACASGPQGPALETGGATYRAFNHGAERVADCDFNGSGATDFVATGRSPEDAGRTTVLAIDGGRLRQPLNLQRDFADLATGDWDADGHCDFAGIPGGSSRNDVRVFFGGPRATFPATLGRTARPDHPRALASGDFTGDGVADLAVLYKTFRGGDNVVVLPGGPDRDQPRASHQHRLKGTARAARTADLDGDGDTDLVVLRADRRVTVLENRAGRLSPTDTAAYGTAPAGGRLDAELAVGDFDGDGDREPVVLDRGERRLFLFDGDPRPAITQSYRLSGGRAPRALAVADLDGDGVSDLLVGAGEAEPRLTALRVRPGDGGPTLRDTGSLVLEGLTRVDRVRFTDFDGERGAGAVVWGLRGEAPRIGLVRDIRIAVPRP